MSYIAGYFSVILLSWLMEDSLINTTVSLLVLSAVYYIEYMFSKK